MGLYAYGGYFPGSELAIGYILVKFTGKIRQPANVALAAFFSKAFPVLTLVKSGPLLGIVYPASPSSDASLPPSSSKQPESWSQRFQTMFESTVVGPVDTYGFSLYLAGKINIAFTIVAAAICIRQGVDANSILSSFGISETLQSGGSAMAAATVTNVFLLPPQLWVFPHLANTVARVYARHGPGQH